MEKEAEKTKVRHKRKLQSLIGKIKIRTREEEDLEPDLSGTHLKKWREKWVKKHLGKGVDGTTTNVVGTGLKLRGCRRQVPYTEYIVACESACSKLPWEEAQSLRAEVTGMLKSARVPKSNICKEERVALKELQKTC